jgi:hypothetical protein
MSQQRRSRFSPTQITYVWRRWKAGQSLHDIGRAYGKPHPSIRCVLLPRGGIAPAAHDSPSATDTFVSGNIAPTAINQTTCEMLRTGRLVLSLSSSITSKSLNSFS